AQATDPKKKMDLLEGLADKLFRPGLLEPRVAHNDDLIKVYYDFTGQLIAADKFAHVHERTTRLLDKYEELLLAGCDASLRNCRNLEFFRKVGNARDVILARITSPDSLRCLGAEEGAFQRRIEAAYALAPVGTDEPYLDALYAKCSISRL